MDKIIKLLLGDDWETTVAGAVAGGATVAFEMMGAGQFDWKILGPAVGLTILGRLSASARKNKNDKA